MEIRTITGGSVSIEEKVNLGCRHEHIELANYCGDHPHFECTDCGRRLSKEQFEAVRRLHGGAKAVREHIFYKCPPDCIGYQYCNGGLMSCVVCRRGEAELQEHCPDPVAYVYHPESECAFPVYTEKQLAEALEHGDCSQVSEYFCVMVEVGLYDAIDHEWDLKHNWSCADVEAM